MTALGTRPAPDAHAGASGLERAVGVAVLLLGAGAFLTVLRPGAGDSDPLILAAWVLAYGVAGVLALVLPDGGRVRVPVAATALVALAGASVLWSAAPGVTMRRSFALAGTAVIGLFLARRLRPVQLLEVLQLAMLVIAAGSLVVLVVFPGTALDPVHDTLRGALSTKNSLGRAMALGLVATTALQLVSSPRPWRLRTALLVVVLAMTTSKSALFAAVALSLLLLAVHLYRRHSSRGLLVGLLLIVSAVAVLVLPRLTAADAADAVGRDITLTGRTELWDEAGAAIDEQPVVGYGYGAFWHEDGPVIRARIIARAGWDIPHAHNGFLDLMLGLGWAGLALAVASIVGVLVRALSEIGSGELEAGTARLAVVSFVVFTNFTESGLYAENQLLTLLLFAVLLLPASGPDTEPLPLRSRWR